MLLMSCLVGERFLSEEVVFLSTKWMVAQGYNSQLRSLLLPDLVGNRVIS